MPLPDNHPLNEAVVYATGANLASGANAAARAPFRGVVTKVGVVAGVATAAGAATVTVSIAGAAITGGVITVPNPTAAGSVVTAVPSGANTCNEDDGITFAVTGTASGGTNATHFAVIRRA
jgi:hypothetical protein